jgi:hypothetical protein
MNKFKGKRVELPSYIAVLILSVFFFFFLAGCERSDHNFTRYPGFAEYFKANPPSNDLPGSNEEHLLRRFQPRFMLAEGQAGAIDFYRDYISSGVLSDGDGNVGAVVYGRIDRETVSFDTEDGRALKPLTFLTYHIVFRNSGVPAGIPGWQEAVIGLLFDLNDWHQLDHYTAATIIIEENGQGGAIPVAVMLQQHNNLRTYIIGEGITLPDDGRVVIDVAKRSNELYPFTPGPVRYRAVNMPDPEGMRFLLTGEKKHLLAGYDVTDGSIEVEYKLELLPHDDAFYTFKGFLGERRRIKGRDAPNGADYNTLPQLKPLQMQLFSGYWREDHRGDIERLEKTILRNGDYKGFARLQGAEFYKSWKLFNQGK